jgi:hypothetical protein
MGAGPGLGPLHPTLFRDFRDPQKTSHQIYNTKGGFTLARNHYGQYFLENSIANPKYILNSMVFENSFGKMCNLKESSFHMSITFCRYILNSLTLMEETREGENSPL